MQQIHSLGQNTDTAGFEFAAKCEEERRKSAISFLCIVKYNMTSQVCAFIHLFLVPVYSGRGRGDLIRSLLDHF